MQTATLVSGETTRYLQEIRRFPMLDAEEEVLLAKRWRKHGDGDAADKLVTCHLRLVVKIAVGYRGYGLPMSELISEGNVGLMQAVKRFNPEQGFRFATYGMWWIKAAIHEYILRSWSLVKIGTTANQKKLFFNLRKAKSKISALEDGDMHPDQVKLIAQRLRKNALGEALSVLGERERRIFEARQLAEEPITLHELAAEFGISRERVRQIEVRAFQKVQHAAKIAIAHAQPSSALH